MTNHTRRNAVVLFLALGVMLTPARATNLIELYVVAREADPVFATARLEREIVGQTVREARAGVLPFVSAGLEGAKTNQNIKSSDNFLFQVGESDFFSADFLLSLTQPIYRSQNFRRLPQAHTEVRQAEFTLAAAEQDLMLRLSGSVFGFLAARNGLDFAVAERTAIGRQLAETEERLGSGLATLTDVHDARADFALAQTAEIDALDLLEDSRQAIFEITGHFPFDVRELGEAFPLVLPDDVAVERWVEAALFQNLRLKATQEGVEVARLEVRRQRGGRLPNIDLVASYNSNDTGGTVFGGGNEIATTDVAIRIGIPVFDGQRTAALTRTAALRHQLAQQTLEQERRRVERETRSAYHGVVSGVSRVGALERSVFSHGRALAAKEQGFRSGLTTGREVLDARRDLFMARRDYAEARYRYVMSSLRLKQAIGVLGIEDLKEVDEHLR